MMNISVILYATLAAIYDIKSRQIPNVLVLCMIGTWILIISTVLFIDVNQAVFTLIDSGFGFILGGGIFILVYFVSHRGLGGGDVKFVAAAGLYLGLGSTVASIFLGTLLAAITGLVLILFKKITRKDKMPLAPFLLVGIVLTIFLT